MSFRVTLVKEGRRGEPVVRSTNIKGVITESRKYKQTKSLIESLHVLDDEGYKLIVESNNPFVYERGLNESRILDLLKKGKDKLGGALNRALDTTPREAAKTVKDVGQSAVEKTKEIGQSAVEKTKELGQSAVEKTKDAGRSVINKGREVLDSLKSDEDVEAEEEQLAQIRKQRDENKTGTAATPLPDEVVVRERPASYTSSGSSVVKGVSSMSSPSSQSRRGGEKVLSTTSNNYVETPEYKSTKNRLSGTVTMMKKLAEIDIAGFRKLYYALDTAMKELYAKVEDHYNRLDSLKIESVEHGTKDVNWFLEEAGKMRDSYKAAAKELGNDVPYGEYKTLEEKVDDIDVLLKEINENVIALKGKFDSPELRDEEDNMSMSDFAMNLNPALESLEKRTGMSYRKADRIRTLVESIVSRS